MDEVKEVFLFFEEAEVTIYQFDANQLDDSDFITKYNKIKSKRLKIDEIKIILDKLISGEKAEIQLPEFIKPHDEKLQKETALTDIVEKSRDLFKKASTIRVSADKLDHLITNVSDSLPSIHKYRFMQNPLKIKTLVNQLRLLANYQKN